MRIDVASSAPPSSTRAFSFSLATVAMVAAALLIYVSGSFLVAELLGAKRLAQFVLIVPLSLVAAHYWVSKPGRLLDPLVGFVLVKLATELVFRGEIVWVLDALATLLAITVILSAPESSFRRGATVVVVLAGTFALMALVQGVSLFVWPDLGSYGLQLSEEGTPLNTISHPIAALGIFGEQQYTLFGQDVARLQSFAKEPSLNVVYFLLPASIAFLLGTRTTKFFGVVLVGFCVLSLSGSVYLSLGCAVAWWVVLRVVPMKYALIYGLPALLVLYLYVLRAFGLGPLFDAITFVARYGDFLNKGVSLTTRGNSADVSIDSALASPLGIAVHPDVPGPWLVNASLEAGWLGVLFLLVFLWKLATQLEILNRRTGPVSDARIGSLLLLGAMSTVMVFNDYQMSNYAGVVLLAFLYRLVLIRNEESDRIHADD